MLNLICERHGLSRSSVPLTIDLPGHYIHQPNRFVMLFNGYSRLSYLTAPGAEALVRQWLAAGQVSPIPGDDSGQALPYMIEIGPAVTHLSHDLGRRILLADSYAHGAGLAPLQYFTSDYGAFCFAPQNGAFSPTTHCPPNTVIWGNWWPTVYYLRHGNQAREALAGGRQ
jgi:hypothetical protein